MLPDSSAADLFWAVFSNTGSVLAYLLYRRFTVH